MHLDLMEYLCCPHGCKGNLRLQPHHRKENTIISGSLICTDCARVYTVEDGIARLLPDDLRSDADIPCEDESVQSKRSEMNARDNQVESYDKMWYLNLYGLAEIPMTLSMLSMDSRHIMLEGGCGTGRMTRDFAKRCHRLISVDFSLQSLKVNSAKLQAHHIKNVDLIQADLCRLPIRSEVIDRVASCGVLEHIPTQECRLAAVKDLTRVLKHGGAMAMSAYNHSLFTRLFGEKEGEHDGGIYYLRFSRKELRALLSQAIRVETITSSLVYYHMARCVKTGSSS